MKTRTLLTITSGIIMNLAASSGAFAETGQKVYSSGILVLVFIGFVALVVVVQMIPAMITMIGMLRSLVSDKKKVTAKHQ